MSNYNKQLASLDQELAQAMNEMAVARKQLADAHEAVEACKVRVSAIGKSVTAFFGVGPER